MIDDPAAPSSGGAPGTPHFPPPAAILFPGQPVSYIHSDVFDRVVHEQTDVVGLVAYGLYQQRKRQWLADYEAQHNRKPCVQELENFSFGFRGAALEALREEAEGGIVRIAEALSEERMPEMQERAFNARTTQELEQLKSAVTKVGSFRHHIIGHVVGFVVLVLLVFVGTIIVSYEPHVGAWAGKLVPSSTPGDKTGH